MHPVLRLAALVCVAAATPMAAQPDGEASRGPITYLIDMRPLEGEEHEVYDRLVRTIARLDPGAPLAEAIAAIDRLVDEIEGAPDSLWPASRDTLIDHLGERLAARGEFRELLLRLLTSERVGLQQVALRILAWDGVETCPEQVAALLVDLLRDPTVDPRVRGNIMARFLLEYDFERVLPTAEALARGTDAELAGDAAWTLCADMPGVDLDVARLSGYLYGQVPILRRCAARTLAAVFPPIRDVPREPLARVVVATMLDERLTPRERGRAIAAARHLLDDAEVRAACIALLEPEAWFFGIPDNHGTSHSLVGVVETLGWSEDPRVRERLVALRDELRRLDEHDRAVVASTLQRVLQNSSPAD